MGSFSSHLAGAFGEDPNPARPVKKHNIVQTSHRNQSIDHFKYIFVLVAVTVSKCITSVMISQIKPFTDSVKG